MDPSYDPARQREAPAAGRAVPVTSAAALTSTTGAIRQVRDGRRDPASVLLEGVHALKHAVRFGARLRAIVTPDPGEVARLLAELAPDVRLPVVPVTVDHRTWRGLAGRELPSPSLAVADRPSVGTADVLTSPGTIVVLEGPRHLGNLGAAVRVAAAAGAGGILVVGDADPWHPTAVRAAAGLQFALPVARTERLPDTSRPVVALTPDGGPLGPSSLPPETLLLVGTERGGLSDGLDARADVRLAIPMRRGVSSLNLATAVAVALYVGAPPTAA